MAQSNNLEKDYYINNRKFNFKIKELQYVLLGHQHQDHSGLLPLLVKRGLNCPIIVPQGCKRILVDMLIDSATILEKEAETLSIRKGREVSPIYTIEDVTATTEMISEYPLYKKIKLNDNIEFKFVNAGHIICGAQIELWLTENNTTKKILYTSDLGNNYINKYYVDTFDPVAKADLVIGETTYAAKGRPQATYQQRLKDREKIKSIIEETCIYNKARVLIPCFALDRLPEILTEIYMIFKDKDFDIPVLIDTPLGLKHIKSYFNILTGEKYELLKEVMAWKNIKQIGEYPESKHWAESTTPCVILASSGMLTAGRALVYAPYILSNQYNHIIFVGYASENSLAWKIKNDKENKWLEIGDKKCRNNCRITSLYSYSSHMQYDALLWYYSYINCNNIVLVHGRMEDKAMFAQELNEILSKKAKTTKISIANKSLNLKL